MISNWTVAASPKLVTMYSAWALSPGATSIRDELAVISTDVDDGMMGGNNKRQNKFPASL